ncbi:MAG: stage 0 sporulation protein [Acholeplasmatales bacterium]|jgi:cell fate regulator YaaT (PSP1 superfamily)|nr:stage 0 sporulation protein [Acholeplasmatales bacterium]
MTNLCIVSLLSTPKSYTYKSGNFNLSVLDYVVVETILGYELGKITKIYSMEDNQITEEVKGIIRLADAKDISEYDLNVSLEQEIVPVVKSLCSNNNLDIKILRANYSLDRRKLMIFFESEERVDFRSLVKDINDRYHTRIELRQIGSRDSAKIIGGIGQCGLIFCCQRFLKEFDVVSIKMAKNQNMSLNPQKISGNCGKLLCCIKYEDELYTALKKELPQIGTKVNYDKTIYEIIETNIFEKRLKLRNQNGGIVWIDSSEIK